MISTNGNITSYYGDGSGCRCLCIYIILMGNLEYMIISLHDATVSSSMTPPPELHTSISHTWYMVPPISRLLPNPSPDGYSGLNSPQSLTSNVPATPLTNAIASSTTGLPAPFPAPSSPAAAAAGGPSYSGCQTRLSRTISAACVTGQLTVTRRSVFCASRRKITISRSV